MNMKKMNAKLEGINKKIDHDIIFFPIIGGRTNAYTTSMKE
jgi:hypothetical protein